MEFKKFMCKWALKLNQFGQIMGILKYKMQLDLGKKSIWASKSMMGWAL